jgi:hypothetical protein
MIGASPTKLTRFDLIALEPRGSIGFVHVYFDPMSGRELAVKSDGGQSV